MAERQKRLASTVNDPNDDLDDELDADLKRRRVAAVTAWRARQAMLLTCCAAAITVCHHAADVSARQRHDPIVRHLAQRTDHLACGSRHCLPQSHVRVTVGQVVAHRAAYGISRCQSFPRPTSICRTGVCLRRGTLTTSSNGCCGWTAPPRRRYLNTSKPSSSCASQTTAVPSL
jgi:hypothetical protein